MSPLHSLSTAPPQLVALSAGCRRMKAGCCCSRQWSLSPASGWLYDAQEVVTCLWAAGAPDLAELSGKHNGTELLLWLPPGSPVLLPSLPMATPDSTRGKSGVQPMFPDLPLPKIKLLHENIFLLRVHTASTWWKIPHKEPPSLLSSVRCQLLSGQEML